jgi:hypothetical protein
LIRLCSQRLLVLSHLLSDRQHHRLESHARELKSSNVVQKRYDQGGKLEKDVKIKKNKKRKFNWSRYRAIKTPIFFSFLNWNPIQSKNKETETLFKKYFGNL